MRNENDGDMIMMILMTIFRRLNQLGLENHIFTILEDVTLKRGDFSNF